jgi:hypothetical protein
MLSPVKLAAWLLVGASLVACSSRAPLTQTQSSVQTDSSGATAVTAPNTPLTITRGGVASVGLPSAGGGGYAWHLETTFDSRLVRLKEKRYGEQPANAPLGKFADEIFDFEGLAAGTTTLVFSQYRDWEGPSRATETRRFPVTVQ